MNTPTDEELTRAAARLVWPDCDPIVWHESLHTLIADVEGYIGGRLFRPLRLDADGRADALLVQKALCENRYLTITKIDDTYALELRTKHGLSQYGAVDKSLNRALCLLAHQLVGSENNGN